MTWAINDKQKFSGWYAYQYKVDPHWLIQVFNVSPEAARVTTWHTQLSTTKWTYARTNNLLFEAGIAAGGSPDTIKTDLALTGGPVTFPLTSTSRVPLVEQASNLNYRAPTNWDWDDRLPSQSFNGVDELRHRLAQREVRLRNAARPLPARRQQRHDGRALVHGRGRRARSSSRFSRRSPVGRTTSTTTSASSRRISGR